MNEERLRARAVALGARAADMVITGGRIVDVWTGEIRDGGVAIVGQVIAATGEVGHTIGDETSTVDVDGKYLLPGFIDCHIHVGASQLNMTELAKLMLAHGTAAICTDFYEVATLAGPDAQRFCLDELKATPLHVLFSSAFFALLGNGLYGNPGVYTGADLVESLEWPEIVGTREWNAEMADVPIEPLHEFLSATSDRGLLCEGHLEGRNARALQAAVAYGARTDHEMADGDEAIDRLRLGLAVQIRQGSSIWDLENVLRDLAKADVDLRNVMFSTDEMDADEMARGYLESRMRIAVECGIEPVTAVQMGTLNAAQFFRITDRLGSIAPGRDAFVVVVDDLVEFSVRKVIAKGHLVAEDGRYLEELSPPSYPADAYRSIRVGREHLSAEVFRIAAPATDTVKVRTIGVREGSCLTETVISEVPVEDGVVRADPGRDFAKIALIDRSEESGRIGIGFVTGFGLRAGAFGTTFNPGICDLLVVGTNDEDMALVADRLIELNGGYVVARDGQVLAELAMPLWGIHSDKTWEEAVSSLTSVHEAIRDQLGSPFRGIHTGAGFLCLAVSIPTLKISSHGLVNVDRGGPQEAVGLFVTE